MPKNNRSCWIPRVLQITPPLHLPSRLWVWILLWLASMGLGHAGDSMEEPAQQTRASHLVKFTHYIEWPSHAFPAPESPIVIGTIGSETAANELQRLTQHQQAEQRKVVVKQLTTDDNPAGIHILYIGSRAGSKVREWLRTLETQPMLVVCDATHELASACAIKFILENNRLRFDIALPPAEQNGIRITAPLLTVARQVHK